MDPFNDVKAEVEATLVQLHEQHESYKRLRAGAAHVQPDELSWAEDELKATLLVLEGDLEELEDSIAAVERSGQQARFGLSSEEMQGRKDFVKQSKSSMQSMRSSVAGESTSGKSRPNSYAQQTSYRDDDDDLEEGDPNSEFEIQQQEMIMRQQDTTLDSIAGVVGTLKQQASVMGHEVMDQVSMLSSLDQNVDRTQNRLDSAQRKMNNFIRQNKNSKSSWCILLLIVVLCLLLLLIVIV